MGILNKYKVIEIPSKKTEEWLLNKHYAKRKCNVMKSFALVNGEEIVGVCTFGMPPTPFFSKLFDKGTYCELNRLITNDGLEKNALSYFVSQCLKMLNNKVIVSYSDANQKHNGYIYQATNWIYTGVGRVNQKDKRGVNKFFFNGNEYHERHIPENMIALKFDIDSNLTKNENWVKNGGEIVKQERKHRYFFVVGDKNFKKHNTEIIKNHFIIYPYPKGQNENYDTSYEIKDKFLEPKLF